MLDELDKELERRGHKFCRYADDQNIYVKSKRAGERVMKSITQFLEGELKLKVNLAKSAVDRPWKRKFLGFTFYRKSALDEWIRRRIRMCIWKQWRKIQTRHDNLVQLGIENSKAWEFANTRKGYWRIAGSLILNQAFTNERIAKLGFKSLTKRYALAR